RSGLTGGVGSGAQLSRLALQSERRPQYSRSRWKTSQCPPNGFSQRVFAIQGEWRSRHRGEPFPHNNRETTARSPNNDQCTAQLAWPLVQRNLPGTLVLPLASPPKGARATHPRLGLL